jgi:hypothetical protein
VREAASSSWRAAISPAQARPEGRRRVTGPLAAAVAGPVGPVAVAEEAVAAAGAGPGAAAEEAVAGWRRRWPRAATSAGAASAHRSTSRPTSAIACRPYGVRRDHPGAYRRSSSGRANGADAAPAAHPTYAGTHSAKSSAVAYSRLINPRRGPTGPPRRRTPASSSATTTGRRSPTSISRTSRGGQAPHPRRGAARCYQCC